MGTVEQLSHKMKVFLYISALAAAAIAQYAAPLVHHAPVVAHAVAAEVYPDGVSPYTYNYAVADDYSNSNFQAAESSDGLANKDGSYSVALPDGRIQHVNYHADDVQGYVAEVTYDGTAAYPEAVAVGHGVGIGHGVGHGVVSHGVVAHPVAVATAHPVVSHRVVA